MSSEHTVDLLGVSRVMTARAVQALADSCRVGAVLEGLEQRLLLSGPPTLALKPSSDSGALLDNVTNVNQPVFEGAAWADGTIHVYADGTDIGSVTVGNDASYGTPTDGLGSWEVTAGAPLADGAYVIAAVWSGMVFSETSDPLVVVIDTAIANPAAPDLLVSSDTFDNVGAPANRQGTSADNVTRINQPAFSGTTEANALVRVFAGGTLVGQGVANAGGTWEVTVEPLADGVYAITTQSEDLAGTVSNLSPALSVTVDTAAPAQPVLDLADALDTGRSALDNVTRAASPVAITVKADAGTHVLIRNGADVIDDFVMVGTSMNRSLAMAADGTYVLTAEAYDAAGNRSETSEPLTVTIDRTAPAATAPALAATSDTGTLGDNRTNLNQPAFVGTAEANAVVRVYAGGVLVGQGVASPSGAWEITVEPLADGAYTITTQVEDLAGNTSAVSGAITVTVDTLAPQRPTVDLADALDTGRSNLDNVTKTPNDVALTVTADAGTTVVLKDGNTVIDTFTSAGTDTRTVTLAEGTHLVSAESTDAAGNRSAQSEELVLTIDRTAPAATTPALAATSDTGTPGDNRTNLSQPAFVGTAEANAMVRVYAGGVLVGQGVATPSGAWEITVEPLADGDYTITTQVEDLAGNTSAAGGPITVTVDTLAPQRPTVDLADSLDTGRSNLDNVTKTPNDVALTVTADAGTTVVLKDGNTVIDTFTSAGTDTRTVTLAEGTHLVSAESTDAAGNRSAQSEELVLTIDRTAPAYSAPALLPSSDTFDDVGAPAFQVGTAADGITAINQPAFSGTAEPNAIVRVYANGVLVGQGVANPSGAWEITVEPLADGTYTITTQVEDLAGNISVFDEEGTPPEIVVDTLPPQRPTVDLADALDTGRSNLDNVTKTPNDVVLTVTAEAGTHVLLKDGETVIDEFIMVGTSMDRSVTLAEGTHLVSAEAFDAAGNRSAQAEELVLTIDRTAPAYSAPALLPSSDTFDDVGTPALQVGTASDGITAINQPAFSGTAEANAIVRVYANGVLVGQGVANPSGAWEITVEPLADGTYAITTEVEDLAGNVSVFGEGSTPPEIVVDTLPPQRPTVDLADPLDTGSSDLDNVTNTPNDVVLTVTAEDGTHVLLKDGETVIDEFIMVGTSMDRAVTLAEGTHLVSAEAFDAAGNRSAQAEELVLTVDRTAPAAPTIDLAPYSDSGVSSSDNITKINQPAFVGTAEANAWVRVYADDGDGPVLVGQGRVNSDESDGDASDGLGIWEITVEPLDDGDYIITAEVEDLAGNISDSSPGLELTVDTQAPQRPTVDLVDLDDTGASDLDNVTIGDPTRAPGVVDLRITSDPDTTVYLKDGNTIIMTLTVGATGEIYVTVDFNALAAVTGFPAEGPHPLSAEAEDLAGNISHQSEELLVTVDFTPPVRPTMSLLTAADTLLLNDGVTSMPTPAFSGTAEANSYIRVYANGELVAEGFAGSDESDGNPTDGLGRWRLTSTPLVDDNYIFIAESEDLAGNLSLPSTDLPLTVAVNYGFRVDPLTGALIFYGEDGLADVVTLVLDGAGNVVVNWTQPSVGRIGAGVFAVANTPAITIITFGGDDTLVVDNTNGMLTMPDGILFDGGDGADQLVLTGQTPVDVVTYNVGPRVGDGAVIHQQGTQIQQVRFVNVEPAIDLVAAYELVFNGTPASNMITYEGLGPHSKITQGLDIVTGRLSIDNFEPLEFGQKMALTINGLAGNDTINLNNDEVPPDLVAITLVGGTGNDTLIGSASDDTLLGGSGDDVLIGGDGNDYFEGGPGADVIDGGPGYDSALFMGTAGNDQMAMTPADVVTNGVRDTIANLEAVTLDTGTGNDAVQVYANAGIPGTVDVLTGDGDDDVEVWLANPAPLTRINVVGGANGEPGDFATIIGATGDDQFDVYGDSFNQFGQAQVVLYEIETPTILEGIRIDNDRNTVESNKAFFIDADGNLATVTKSGPGEIDIFRNILHGRAADIYALFTYNTSDFRTRATVSVKRLKGTDNETSIGSVFGTGLGGLTATKSDLVGTHLIGNGVQVTGALQNLRVDDIRDGAHLVIGGQSGRRLVLMADQVGNVDLHTGGIVTRMLVGSWEAGTVQASVFQNVMTLRGGFGADLLNARTKRNGYGLQKLSVKGGALVSNISADRIGSIRVLGGDAMLTVDMISDALTLRGRTAIDSLFVTGGDLVDATFNLQDGTVFKKVSVLGKRGVGGNVVGGFAVNNGGLGSMKVGGNVVTSGWQIGDALGILSVRGIVGASGASAAIRTGGGMGKVTVGALEHVDLMAGIGGAVARQAANAADFDPLASIQALKIKGYRVPRGTPPPRFVVDSNINAASLGKVSLLNADRGAMPYLFVLDQGGAEIVKITAKDTVLPEGNWVYPPTGGAPFSPPDLTLIS